MCESSMYNWFIMWLRWRTIIENNGMQLVHSQPKVNASAIFPAIQKNEQLV